MSARNLKVGVGVAAILKIAISGLTRTLKIRLKRTNKVIKM